MVLQELGDKLTSALHRLQATTVRMLVYAALKTGLPPSFPQPLTPSTSSLRPSYHHYQAFECHV